MADGDTGGEWWRVDGPWRVLGRSAARAEASDDAGESVYAQVPVESPVPLSKEPAAPPDAAADGARLIARATPGRSLTAADFPGWDSVHFDFSAADPPTAEPAASTVPEQRAVETTVSEAPAAGGAAGGTGLLAGRRPSLVVLAAVLVLLAGALTGQFLVLLAGWGLAYVAPRLGDLTRKFGVLGIPLVTMAGSTVWLWGRAKGRWGAPLAQGSQLGHTAWTAAPGVLRLAAVLSALFLLAVTLRRRPPV